MEVTVHLNLQEGLFVTEPEATLRHVLQSISVSNILNMAPNEVIELQDPRDIVVGTIQKHDG